MKDCAEPAAALANFWQMPASPKLDLRKREWIYFLQSCVSPGLIKIGRTRTLKWRILGLQTQCPVALRLLNTVSAPAGTEEIIHKVFDAERQHGEWFMPSPGLLAMIDGLPKGGPLTGASVKAIAVGIDCIPYFERAVLRLGPGGKRKTIQIPNEDAEMKKLAARIAKNAKNPQNLRAMVANLRAKQKVCDVTLGDWRTDF